MHAVAIRPIRNQQDYLAAVGEIGRLVDVPEEAPECEVLEVLSVLVTDYEDKHHPIEGPDPIAFIQAVMEARSISKKEMEQYIGTRAMVADVLNR